MELYEKKKRSQSLRTQVKVCNVCGSRGFSNALVYCSQCSCTTVHLYCVGMLPGNLADVNNWVCEYCSAVLEPESFTCHAFASASDKRSPESCMVHAEALTMKSKSEIMVISDQPEPLCVLYPVTCKGNSEHAEACTMKSKSEIMVFSDQPEPLCVLYPVTCKGNSEHEELRSYSQVSEEILSTASISLGDSLDYQEENERSVSSFMEHPEWLMYGVVLVVSPSGNIIICRSLDICDEHNSQNAGDSVTIGYLSYGEEPGAQVSSFMEHPEEISGELVLLVKPTGEIIIDCGVSSHDDSHFSCGEAAAHNLVNKSSEINSVPGSFSFDEVIDRYENFAYDSCMEDVEPICALSKETVKWSSNASDGFSKTDMQGDTGFEYMFDASESMEGNIQQSNEALDVDGFESKRGMSHYIPPIRPECKRSRRKRYKISPSATKEVNVCRVAAAEDLPDTTFGYKKDAKQKKMTIMKSLAPCGLVPPLKRDCKRARSKRWQRSDTPSKGGICATGIFFTGGEVRKRDYNEEECSPHGVVEIKKSEIAIDEVYDTSSVDQLVILTRDEENGRLVNEVVDHCVGSKRGRVCIVNRPPGQV